MNCSRAAALVLAAAAELNNRPRKRCDFPCKVATARVQKLLAELGARLRLS